MYMRDREKVRESVYMAHLRDKLLQGNRGEFWRPTDLLRETEGGTVRDTFSEIDRVNERRVEEDGNQANGWEEQLGVLKRCTAGWKELGVLDFVWR